MAAAKKPSNKKIAVYSDEQGGEWFYKLMLKNGREMMTSIPFNRKGNATNQAIQVAEMFREDVEVFVNGTCVFRGGKKLDVELDDNPVPKRTRTAKKAAAKRPAKKAAAKKAPAKKAAPRKQSAAGKKAVKAPTVVKEAAKKPRRKVRKPAA